MTIIRLLYLSALAVLLLHAVPSISFSASPEGGVSQSGTLDMRIGEDGKDPYKTAQANALNFMSALQAKIPALKDGHISAIEQPKDSAINHLTGVYLYCTITKAICPEILDALLEADLINSRISKKAECPTLLSFWKKWQANDLEARQRFLVRIGNLGTTGEFTENVRPKYIRCRDTIKQISAGDGSDVEYFKKRYGGPASPEANIKKAADYVKAIAGHTSNVFAELEHLQK